MKQFQFLLMLLISLTIVQCQLSNDDREFISFNIEGQITADGTGEPLDSIHVQLVEMITVNDLLYGGTYTTDNELISTYTDENGYYSINYIKWSNNYRENRLQANNIVSGYSDNCLYDAQKVPIAPSLRTKNFALKGNAWLKMKFEETSDNFNYNYIDFKAINPIDNTEWRPSLVKSLSKGVNGSYKITPGQWNVQIRPYKRHFGPTNEFIIDTLINFEQGKSYTIPIPY